MLFVVVNESAVDGEPIRCIDEAHGPFEGKDLVDAERNVFEHFQESPDTESPKENPTPIEWLVHNGLRVVPLESDFNDQMPKAT